MALYFINLWVRVEFSIDLTNIFAQSSQDLNYAPLNDSTLMDPNTQGDIDLPHDESFNFEVENQHLDNFFDILAQSFPDLTYMPQKDSTLMTPNNQSSLDLPHDEPFNFEFEDQHLEAALFDSEADEALPDQGEADAWLLDGGPTFQQQSVTDGFETETESDGKYLSIWILSTWRRD